MLKCVDLYNLNHKLKYFSNEFKNSFSYSFNETKQWPGENQIENEPTDDKPQ